MEDKIKQILKPLQIQTSEENGSLNNFWVEHLLKGEAGSPEGIRQLLLRQGEDSHISAIIALTNYIKSKTIP